MLGCSLQCEATVFKRTLKRSSGAYCKEGTKMKDDLREVLLQFLCFTFCVVACVPRVSANKSKDYFRLA